MVDTYLKGCTKGVLLERRLTRVKGIPMHVSFEVRLKIAHKGRRLMLLRRRALERGQRILHPFGGGIKVTDDDRATFGLDPALTDLRFVAPTDWYLSLDDYFEHQISAERLLFEARREFYEEAVDERRLLTPEELEGSTLDDVKKVVLFEGGVNHATRGESTLYLVGVVTATLSEPAMTRLLDFHGSDQLEFVTFQLLQSGGQTEFLNEVNPLYSYLV